MPDGEGGAGALNEVMLISEAAKNLKQRFNDDPTIDESVILKALRKTKGHAGRAISYITKRKAKPKPLNEGWSRVTKAAWLETAPILGSTGGDLRNAITGQVDELVKEELLGRTIFEMSKSSGTVQKKFSYNGSPFW